VGQTAQADRALVKNCVSGQPGSREALVRTYADLIHHTIVRMLKASRGEIGGHVRGGGATGFTGLP